MHGRRRSGYAGKHATEIEAAAGATRDAVVARLLREARMASLAPRAVRACVLSESAS